MEAVMEIQRISVVRSAHSKSYSANQPRLSHPLTAEELQFYKAVFNEEVSSLDKQIARLKKFKK